MQIIAEWHGKRPLPRRHHAALRDHLDAEQMEAPAALAREFPDLHIQTHLSENHDEIKFTCELYPEATDYTDIYARYGLLGDKTLFGHCIHLSDREADAMSESRLGRRPLPDLEPLPRLRPLPAESACAPGQTGAHRCRHRYRRRFQLFHAAHDGRGLQDPAAAWRTPEPAGKLLPHDAGQRRSLSLAERIGTLDVGSDADIVVLNAAATPAMALKMEVVKTLPEELFVLQTMGDDRAIVETYVAGVAAKSTI